MVKVQVWGSLKSALEGADEIELEATSIREVLEAEARQIATNEVYRPAADGRATPAPGPTIRNDTLARLVHAGFDAAFLDDASGWW